MLAPVSVGEPLAARLTSPFVPASAAPPGAVLSTDAKSSEAESAPTETRRITVLSTVPPSPATARL